MSHDTTEIFESQPTSHPSVPPRTPRRNRRGLAVAAVALVALLGVGGAVALTGGSDDPTGTNRTAAALATTTADTVPTVDPSGDAGGSGGSDTGTPQPPPAPGHVVVSDNHLVLAKNVFTTSVEITNDGGSDVEWQWMSGHPSIAASPSGGVLAPGASVVVELTIAWQQLQNGGFVYQNHVVADGQSVSVTVSGTRDIQVNPGVQLPDPKLTLG